ncbi:RagB/SusD family nutrient uptake outer membrane protein [Olivibacter ginsenosidimutans]|uniref:RagB/SusD family nutrient uptake outer membrane protein n=1 Tax=Olivibacter ginsenosidimutans TaxID=1176537 RepID=A0ABP9CDR1_9SPHI
MRTKEMIKRYMRFSIVLMGMAIAMLSCKKDYEAEPLENVTIEYVFDPNDSLGTNALRFLNSMYADMFPKSVSRNRVDGNLLDAASDDAISSNIEDNEASRLAKGQYSAYDRVNSDMIWGDCYKNIRAANVFINHIDVVQVNDSKFDPLPSGLTVKRTWKAEARFLRALAYFELLKRYGGITLMGDRVLELGEDVELPRDTYEACVDYIVQEMDAIQDSLLAYPVPSPSRNSHRVTKGAAMALKARILLYAASPLANGENIDGSNPLTGYPSFDAERWARAAEAAKAIIDLQTYALEENAKEIFTRQYNKEIIFFKQWGNNKDIENANGPFGFGTQIGGEGRTSPTQEFVEAFPMNTGEPINTSGNYDPNNPYTNRDPRLAMNVLYNGATWLRTPLQTFDGGRNKPGGTELQTRTSYYMRKFMGDFEEASQYSEVQRDYILFRYTEVILNYIEALNEYSGPVQAVYDQLQALRQRAGILAGDDGHYGIPTNLSKEQMRDLIRNERRLELAFEEHRYWDIRRWKLAGEVMGKPLHGMQITQSAGMLTYNRVEVFEPGFTSNMYFYPIPDSEVLKNTHMKQNPGWN